VPPQLSTTHSLSDYIAADNNRGNDCHSMLHSARLLMATSLILFVRGCSATCLDGLLSLDLGGEYFVVTTGVRTNCSATDKPLCCECSGHESIRNFDNEVLIHSCATACTPEDAIPDNTVSHVSAFVCQQLDTEETIGEEPRAIAIIVVCSVLLVIGIVIAAKYGRTKDSFKREWEKERLRISEASFLQLCSLCVAHRFGWCGSVLFSPWQLPKWCMFAFVLRQLAHVCQLHCMLVGLRA